MKYWQVCPLGPTGFGDSPYQCFSAFAGNPYLIDLDDLKSEGLLEEADIEPLRALPTGYVDYGAQWELRWIILQKAFAKFQEIAKGQSQEAFHHFQEINSDWPESYALFMAVKGQFGHRSWLEWPKSYRKYRTLIKRADMTEAGLAHAFYQFKFFQQWAAMKSYANQRGISIFGDIPIFVAMDSADVWTHPALFQMDENLRPTGVAGVPPDYFAADGQLWGNPLYEWKKHKISRYAWWLSRICGSFELYDVVRIDHFRGFDAYCRIPADAVNAREYEWIAGPGIDLFKAI